MSQAGFVRKTVAAAKAWLFGRIEPAPDLGTEPAPDLGSELEELLIEVWRQEAFERKHPFTCAAIRQASSSLQTLARSESKCPLTRP